MLIIVFVLKFSTTCCKEINYEKVDSHILSASGLANVLVSFTEGTSSVLKSISKTKFASRASKLSGLRSALVLNAEKVQKNAINLLEGQFPFVKYTSFWITNQLYLTGVDTEVLQLLSILPEVKRISLEQRFDVTDFLPSETSQRQSETEWNIQKIQAEEAVELLRNATSNPAEVIVATISGGVRGSHESLKNNFVADYGWFDTIYGTEVPTDDGDFIGVGTHNMGTICGSGGIGVYPDAKWIACRACDGAGCFTNAILQCAEYIICPTRPNGSDPNCALAPVVVHGNWLAGQGDTDLDETILTLLEAGISSVFPIGGSGPSCETARSPGDSQVPVFSVGGTTSNDSSYERSSAGPSVFGSIKPELTAPGQNIRSALSDADDSYGLLSGTSMASPHVAGVIAILKAYNSSLAWEDLNDILLTDGVETEALIIGERDCGQLVPGVPFPNNIFGWGRINALKALVGALERST
jgi:subtilisin family serine protease